VDRQLDKVEPAVKALRQMKLAEHAFADLRDAAAPPTPSDRKDDAILKRLAGRNVSLSPARPQPRKAVSLAFQVFRDLASEPDETKRANAQRALRDHTLDVIKEVADPQVKRSARHDKNANEALVTRMFDVMHEADPGSPHD
jgi:hypothetical protein